MLKENINELIKQSILNKNSIRTEVLRAVKNEFIKWETAKNAKPLDEVAVLNKMMKQREESSKLYLISNRDDLAQKELQEIKILAEFIPEKASIEDIQKILKEKYGRECFDGVRIIVIEIPKKEMGNAIKYVKSKLNNVDGKQLSELIKNYLI